MDTTKLNVLDSVKKLQNYYTKKPMKDDAVFQNEKQLNVVDLMAFISNVDTVMISVVGRNFRNRPGKGPI